MTADREGNDDGTTDSMELPLGDAKVIAFPHEHHWALTQEWLATFGGAGNICVVDMVPGSGAKLLGVLLSNGRGIGVGRNAAHVKWMTENLVEWVRQKRLVTINQIPKPESLVNWEKQNRQSQPVPKAPVTPSPKAVPVVAQTPSPSPATQSAPSNPGVKPTGLLEAFGKVAQWLERMRQGGTWGDTAMLHCIGMIMIALCNDFHFWGLEPEASGDDNDGEQDSPDVSEYPCSDRLEEVWLDDSVSKQLALVECLQEWDPWAEPTVALIEKFELLSNVSSPFMQGAALFKARQFAMYQLSREQQAYEELGDSV
eukprot:s410_g13.t1